MARTKRVAFTPSPQADEKISKAIDASGLNRTKSEIVRSVLHKAAINYPELFK